MFFRVHNNVRIDNDMNYSFVVEGLVETEEEAGKLGEQAMKLSLAYVKGASSVLEEIDEDED